MNKLAIFDLDGVLCQLGSIHFSSLNHALVHSGYPAISVEDHFRKFDGLPTSKKLDMLGIPKEDREKIQHNKQLATIHFIKQHVKPNPELARILHEVYAKGHLIAVVSNAKYETVHECLKAMSIEFLVSWIVTPDSSNCDPKPSPAMYLKAMKVANSCPLMTTVFEDSPTGIRGATLSGAYVAQIYGGLTYDDVMSILSSCGDPVVKYGWSNLNVLIPAAGKGDRFAKAGYKTPKPFIDVGGLPMIDVASNSLLVEAEFSFILQEKDTVGFGCNANLFTINSQTRGTAETCLQAISVIDNESPLLIANCDQVLEWDNLAFYHFCRHSKLDGVIVTFPCETKDPRWSYCEVGDNGLVKRVAEKDPISNKANVGVYFWKRGEDFVKYTEKMIEKDMRVNGEFYVAPVYNLAIEDGKRIGVFDVDKFWSLGTPELLKEYMEKNA